MLRANTTILFQGDSITDAGRCYDTALQNGKPPADLGQGYPKKIKEYLDIFCADLNITVLNRGISGNRVCNLQSRWEEDCIALKPDYLSIMIGVNDTWRRYDANNPTSAADYETVYRDILTRAKKELDCEFILLEPYLIPTDSEKEGWYEDLTGKILAARKLAREFHATYLPLDGIFAEKRRDMPAEHWSQDGVHPTDAGHALIAKLWLDAML